MNAIKSSKGHVGHAFDHSAERRVADWIAAPPPCRRTRLSHHDGASQCPRDPPDL